VSASFNSCKIINRFRHKPNGSFLLVSNLLHIRLSLYDGGKINIISLFLGCLLYVTFTAYAFMTRIRSFESIMIL